MTISSFAQYSSRRERVGRGRLLVPILATGGRGGCGEGAPGGLPGGVGGRPLHGLVLHHAGRELGLCLGEARSRRLVQLVDLEMKRAF